MKYLAGAYFHQDCPFDENSPLDGVREYLTHELPVTVAGLLNDLESAARDGMTEEQAKSLWRDNAVLYDPEASGLTYLEWLGQIRILVESENL